MPRLKYSVEQIIHKLWEAEVLLAQGQTVKGICRKWSITDPTYYRWRQEYGGLKLDQAKRLKDLERENARLKRAVADLTPDKLILAEHGEGGRLDTMPLAAFVKARTHLLMLEGGDARELDPFVRGS